MRFRVLFGFFPGPVRRIIVDHDDFVVDAGEGGLDGLQEAEDIVRLVVGGNDQG